MEKVKLDAPWVEFRKEVWNAFKDDAEVTVDDELVELENGNYKFAIKSENREKLAAIRKLVGSMVVFGNVNLIIEYDNGDAEVTAETWKTAFAGNPIFKDVISTEPPAFAATYAVFAKQIVTFYDDNLADYKGNKHIIAADLVRDIVANPNAYICTEN